MKELIGGIVGFFVLIISGLLMKGKREKDALKKKINSVSNEAHNQRRKNHVKVVERINKDHDDAVDTPIADWVEERLGSREGSSSTVEGEPKGGPGGNAA